MPSFYYDCISHCMFIFWHYFPKFSHKCVQSHLYLHFVLGIHVVWYNACIIATNKDGLFFQGMENTISNFEPSGSIPVNTLNHTALSRIDRDLTACPTICTGFYMKPSTETYRYYSPDHMRNSHGLFSQQERLLHALKEASASKLLFYRKHC